MPAIAEVWPCQLIYMVLSYCRVLTYAVFGPAQFAVLSGTASGFCFAAPNSPRPNPFSPRHPPSPAHRQICSSASQIVRICPTSCCRSSPDYLLKVAGAEHCATSVRQQDLLSFVDCARFAMLVDGIKKIQQAGFFQYRSRVECLNTCSGSQTAWRPYATRDSRDI